MKTLLIIFIFGLISCSNTTQKDVFEVARHGEISEMKTLLNQNPVLLQSKNKSGFTLLILASYSGNEKIVRLLTKEGAKLDVMSDMGTALMAAVYKSQNSIAEILINKGANVNLSDKNGTTALHYSCFKQNNELVKMLIHHKANINSKDDKGKTPLDYAIENNNIETLKLLQSKTN